MNQSRFKRGDIYLANLDWAYDSCVIKGIHPVLLVSNDVSNLNSTLVNVVPITSKKKKHLPVHVDLKGCGLKKDSTVIVEQVLTIDKSALIRYIGSVDKIKMNDISTALKKQLSLPQSA